MNTFQTDFNSTPPPSSRRKILAWFGLLFLLFVLIGTFRVVQGFFHHEITVENQDPALKRKLDAVILPFKEDQPDDKEYVMPTKEKNRIDILILGMRGKDDVVNGGLLTDTILLLSYDQVTGRTSLVSIPRDLYVKIGVNIKDKINSALERLGVSETKKLFSRITGVYIDQIAIFDFTAFKETVNAVGGIDITLDKPFEETQQWGYTFSLPAGPNHLDGDSALYFVRSRYTSNDFDRAERQQKVILALKAKILETNFITDPVRAFTLVNTLRKNVQTDIDILNIKTLLELASKISGPNSTLKREVLTTDNYLYDTKTSEGAYILLPKGDSLQGIKDFFQKILLSPKS